MDEPKKNDIKFGDAFCENCGHLPYWQGAIFNGLNWRCLTCASSIPDKYKKGIVEKAKELESARRSFYNESMQAMDEMTESTYDSVMED